MSRRGRDPYLLVLCLLCLALCVIALPFSLAASRNEGTPGTFTASEKSCSRTGGCPWLGTFESNDGQIRERTTMYSDKLDRRGDKVDAQKVGEEVYRADSKAWVFILAALVGSFAYVVWFLWSLRRGAPEKHSEGGTMGKQLHA